MPPQGKSQGIVYQPGGGGSGAGADLGLSAAQAIAASTPTTIALDTVISDPGGWVSGDTIVIPKNGDYLVNAAARIQDFVLAKLAIMKNGSTVLVEGIAESGDQYLTLADTSDGYSIFIGLQDPVVPTVSPTQTADISGTETLSYGGTDWSAGGGPGSGGLGSQWYNNAPQDPNEYPSPGLATGVTTRSVAVWGGYTGVTRVQARITNLSAVLFPWPPSGPTFDAFPPTVDIPFELVLVDFAGVPPTTQGIDLTGYAQTVVATGTVPGTVGGSGINTPGHIDIDVTFTNPYPDLAMFLKMSAPDLPYDAVLRGASFYTFSQQAASPSWIMQFSTTSNPPDYGGDFFYAPVYVEFGTIFSPGPPYYSYDGNIVTVEGIARPKARKRVLLLAGDVISLRLD